MGESRRAVWDDLKSEKNLSAHGIDFVDLDSAFDGRFPRVVEDKRRDYGERRFNMLIELHGSVVNITFTSRPPKYRIISARLASRKERRELYAQGKNP